MLSLGVGDVTKQSTEIQKMLKRGYHVFCLPIIFYIFQVWWWQINQGMSNNMYLCDSTDVKKNIFFSPVTRRITRHHIVYASVRKKCVANVYQRLRFTGEIRSACKHLFKKTIFKKGARISICNIFNALNDFKPKFECLLTSYKWDTELRFFVM